MIAVQTRCALSLSLATFLATTAEARLVFVSRPIQVLSRVDFWQASSSSSPSSSSLESFLHSYIVSSESCQAGCCRRKPLCLPECSLSTSSLVQGSIRKRPVSAGSRRIATMCSTQNVMALHSAAALSVERLTENAELDVCRGHAVMDTLPEAIRSFTTSNGSTRFAAELVASTSTSHLASKKEEEEEEEEEDGPLMPFAVKEGIEACLQPVLKKQLLAEPVHVPHGSSLLFSDLDTTSSALDNEVHLLEQEKLRRKRISEANKNRVPWNKGKQYKQGNPRISEAATNKDITVLDNDANIILKEKQRRERIAAANLGKVPWNKGRQHSEETRRRIRERTAEAMRNPKIREKLRVHASTLSNETKSRISAGLVLMWKARKKLKQEQDNCEEEWKEYVADAARMGNGDDDEYDWSSYDATLRDLKKGWQSNCVRRRVRDRRRPMTSAHRIKISNAIKAKWTNLNYRSSVEAAVQAHREKQGTEHVKVERRHKIKKSILKKEKLHDTCVKSDEDLVLSADSKLGIESESLQPMQNVQPAYRNPLNDEMLENLKQIRAKRRSKERSRNSALERARILMAEAQMAARALEAQAATDQRTLPLLQEAQRFLAEAAESFKAAGLPADFP